MKRNLLILCCLLITISSLSQAPPKFVKMGDIEIVNLGDGQLYAYKNDSVEDALDGKMRIIHGQATEYIDADFKNGYPEGRWEHFKDNVLINYKSYKNGYLDGDFVKMNALGEVEETGFYENGKRQGVQIKYYSPDKKEIEEHFKDGELRKEIRYFIDGNIASEREYLNKRQHGTQKEYDYETGKIKSEGYYENGEPVGTQKYFFFNNVGDSYVKISNFSKEGKQDGKYTETYLDTNKPKVEGQYKDNKKTGVWKYFNIKGEQTKEEKYENGKMIERKEFGD